MTPEIYAWAERNNVSHKAMLELKTMFGMTGSTYVQGPFAPAISEEGAQQRVRVLAAQAGKLAFRNNVGVMVNVDTGQPVRYGLANDSAKMNKKLKSSDLIGIDPVTITQEMVGGVIGRFWCREIKVPGWRYTGTPREVAQLAFLQLIMSKGGDAAFSTGNI